MDLAVEISNLSFTYSSRQEPTLKEISLTVPRGQFVLITGATGCGKSTLLKTLNGLIPHQSSGKLSGQIRVMGLDTQEHSIPVLAQQVGLVFQSPDEQIFSTIVEDEIVFGPENLGIHPQEIEKRAVEALQAVSMEKFRFAETNALSGGQKQRVALAALKAMEPKILALDEPISQLDPQGAQEVLAILKHLKEKLGMTIILVEHRIHEVAHLVDRVLIMEKGSLVLDQAVPQAFNQGEVFQRYGLRLPETVEISHQLGIKPPCLQVEELAFSLKSRLSPRQPFRPKEKISLQKPGKGTVVKIEDLVFAYQKGAEPTLKKLSLQIKEGERIALMGNNGAGKSTLLKHLMGLLQPDQGKVEILGQDSKKIDSFQLAGKVGMVFQNPDLMLFCDTVEKEIEFGLENLGFSKGIIAKRTKKVLKAMGIEELKADFPLALSRGQRLRVALAAVLALEPELLILDEPTTGQDKAHMETMMDRLAAFTHQGGTLIFCTHDGEIALRYAERIIVLHQGQILADGSPREVFAQEKILQQANLKAPPSCLLTQKLNLPLAFSVEEVLEYVRVHSA